MGLTMPAYAYYLGRGRERKDPEKLKGWNKNSEEALNVLFELLDHPLIKDIAIRKEAVSPRFANIDLSQSNWRMGTMVEEHRFTRPELKRILDELQDRGTIVVPTIGHLKSDHKLMKRLCEHPIAPISIDKIAVKTAILKRALKQLPEGCPTEKFENDVIDFFVWLTQSAVNNQRLLELSRLHFRSKISTPQALARPKRTTKKPKAKNAKKGKKSRQGQLPGSKRARSRSNQK
jgi:hypothetical protein